ncbi:MAG TPA: UvrD-helicase domain-containing protein [Patescibacteria group bacterium]|nr:UvrD-helicase domain-containing protein [Patescibacteria group bacterium]
MKRDLLKDLNEEQAKAVENTQGPMIILAGAGSGKTRVLTYKVIYLINEKGVDPNNILMVTFTNKAAAEMKERVAKAIGKSTAVTISTFHSLCSKILRIDGKYVGVGNSYVIYDTQDQIDAIKEAMKLLGISPKEYKPSSVLNTISQAKNELIDSLGYLNYARGHFQEVVSKVYTVYQKTLKDNNALDFDDLILKTVLLLKENKDILSKYQNKFQYILVDEYQDTNHAQYELTKLLAKKNQNISVVGDFSQSIYSFRGADFQNLKKFEEDFANTKTFKLSQNYRSTQKILDAASSVISKNTSHPILSLWTEKQGGEDINLFEAENEQNEAEFIAGQISNIKYQYPDLKFSDFTILYRTNAQSRSIEEVFLHLSLPYILIGGTRFYERKEIKDILAFLKLLVNPKEKISYKRVEKLGKGRLEKFEEFAKTAELGKATIEILDGVVKKIDYLSMFDEKDEEDRTRLENIKELRSVAIEFPEINNFLENVALVEQEYLPDKPNGDEKKDAVNLMTFHAAKGLEFPVVFMVGMEEGLFPHSRSLMDRNELEEERRLCYVGITRAKEKLFLTYSRRRLYFGQRTSNVVSRFILELPKETLSENLLERQDVPDYL